MNLRQYQHSLIDDIREAWGRVRSILAVLATGGGKTVVLSSIVHDHAGAAAVVVHRKEILSQIACSLAAFGVTHRVIAPPPVVNMIRRKQLKQFGRSFIDPNAQVGVASVQTITSKSAEKNSQLQRWIASVTLCIFDEGHHYVPAGLWGRAVERMSRARLLFVTATPERADGAGLEYAEAVVEGPQTSQLIDDGFLARYTYRSAQTDFDVSDVPVTASGDFNAREFRKRVVESHIVGDVVQQYLQFGNSGRAIVFATDVETAVEMADAFNGAGIAAAALSGKTEAAERERTIAQFEDGAMRVLVNVDLFDEGFDVPGADICIQARPTQSLAKYLQMVGRVLRPVYADGYDLATAEGRKAAQAAGPKPHAIIIDPVRNWERHGLPSWPRVWAVNGREGGGRAKQDGVLLRACTSCTQPYERFYPACPYCGSTPEPASRRTPAQVDGDLHELDVDALTAIFEAQSRAEMDDDEYARDQLARHIPPVGRAADMRRHKAAKYRRAVLRELVGWWVGLQQHTGRELPECHKRFYLRFGIDIGTAFTLNARETDALIEKIGGLFNADVC